MKFNKLEFKIISIYEFIKVHTHILYCEAILLPDGTITYAVPSHQQALLRLLNLTVEEANDLIPIDMDAEEYLCIKTGAILVWYTQIHYYTEITPEQERSLQLLKNHKYIKL